MTTTVAILLTLIWPIQGQTSQPSRTLDVLRDHNRVLLVFAADSFNALLRSQLAQLDGKAMAERDLILVPLLSAWSPGDKDLQITRTTLNSDEEQLHARSRFHVRPDEFTVILIGKDGGEKFRSHAPVTMQQLNRVIDAMPMRQQEMRSRPAP